MAMKYSLVSSLNQRINCMLSNAGSDMIIRKLTSSDVAVFQSLRLEALSTHPEAYASRYEDWAALSAEQWLGRLQENHIFAAFAGPQPVGMMALLPMRASKMAHRGSITMVYVQHAHRGTGVAADLLTALSAEAGELGFRRLELAVNHQNAAALKFYLAQGFSEIGRVPDGFYHDGQYVDEILMSKRIDNATTRSIDL